MSFKPSISVKSSFSTLDGAHWIILANKNF